MFHNMSWEDTKKMYKTWMRWSPGRQKTGYQSLLLFFNPILIPFHVLILRFPEGSCIPPHRDEVKDKKHYRVNLIVKPSKTGGQFLCDKPIFLSKIFNFFRSDLCLHEVTKVEEGTRYVLSLGWVILNGGQNG